MVTTDIQTRDDIKLLITKFYESLLRDEEMKYIFDEVAKVDLIEHSEIIVDFWESILFQLGHYKRNAMEIHLKLHQKFPLSKSHFEKWLAVFESTIDSLFEGATADVAKERARSIGLLMQFKIDQMDKSS